MIALIVTAAVIAVVAVVAATWSLTAVHLLLGRRKPKSVAETGSEAPDGKYGVDFKWWKSADAFSERVSITAYDGVKLGAKLLKHAEPNGRVAICCHGYGARAVSVQPQAKLFYDRGFDVLVPFMRGHEGSEGKVGMAWIDRFDILRWVNKIIDVYGETVSVVLFGISMGGSAVAAAAGMDPPPQVKCFIDDCGFPSQVEQYRACFSSLTVRMIKTGVKLVHGYYADDADIAALAKNARIPALFFHGDKDELVPSALGRKLFEACGSEDKKFVTAAGAGHGRAYATDPETYAAEFTEFIDKHVPGSELVIQQPDLPADEPTEQGGDAEAPQADEPQTDGADTAQ